MTCDDNNSEVPDRVEIRTRTELSGLSELGLGTEAKEESRVPQQDNRDPDPYLFFRSRSETTVTFSERFPGSEP